MHCPHVVRTSLTWVSGSVRGVTVAPFVSCRAPRSVAADQCRQSSAPSQEPLGTRLHAMEGRETRALNRRVARSTIIFITSSATPEPFRSGEIARFCLSSMREKSAGDVRSASLSIDER
jgi:hypothetical protein